MALTKKLLEKKYNCTIFKDTGFDDSRKYWVAESEYFVYVDGWTLEELRNNIEKERSRLMKLYEDNYEGVI